MLERSVHSNPLINWGEAKGKDNERKSERASNQATVVKKILDKNRNEEVMHSNFNFL